MTTTPPAISSLPAPPNPADRSTFNTLAYPWSAALPAFGASVAAVADNVKLNADEGALSATAAASQALIATLQANAAASSALTAGATVWVSGTTYAIGNARFSPINGQTYRRITAGAGTTDPSADATNWTIVNGLVNQAVSIPVNNLPAIRPSLDLDFANGQTVDPRITFTRASTATRTNSRGLIEAVASGVPRIDFDPVTLACKGLLIEEQRTNLLLNSATLVTQNVTVAAVAHTISFYGTGTVTLSGVATGSLVGSGAYPTRSTLTFTPTAGTLVLTVTGSCTDGQIEAGSFATSVIPTVASQVTRVADAASMTGANFSSWYRQDEGSLLANYILSNVITNSNIAGLSDGTTSNRMIIRGASNSTTASIGAVGGVTQWNDGFVSGTANTITQFSLAIKANDIAMSRNGAAVVTDASASLPTVNQLRIGADGDGAGLINGYIRSLSYYPKRLTNAELQALSTQ